MSASIASVDWYNEDSASPLTVSRPAGTSTGDVLVAILVQHAPSGHLSDLTAPTGWTAQGNYAGTNSQAQVFTHVAAGGDPSTWDFPYYVNADVALGLFRVTGADTTPVLVVASTNTTSLTSSYDSPTVTPSGADDLLICTITDISNGSTFSATVPSGMTSRSGTQVAGGFMGQLGASLGLSSGSATGAKTWTSVSPTGADGGSFSVAIKSAAAGTSATLPVAVVQTAPTRHPGAVVLVTATTPPPSDVLPRSFVVAGPRIPGPASIITAISRDVTPIASIDTPRPVYIIAAPGPRRGPVVVTSRSTADPPPTATPPQAYVVANPARRVTTPPIVLSSWAEEVDPPTPLVIAAQRTMPAAAVIVTRTVAEPPVVPPADTPPIAYVIAMVRAPRAGGVLVAQSRADTGVCDCQIHRPVSGTTTRPGSTTISRPFAGVVNRPCTCQ